MSRLIKATSNRIILIITSLVIILVWGAISAYQMQQDYLPPINNPTLMVSIRANDFQADQIKASVLPAIQESVRKVNGLETLETNSFDGGLLMSLYFPMSYDMSHAESDVAYALEHVSLPVGVDKPAVTRVSTSSFPMMRLTLTSPSGKVDENNLRTTIQSELNQALKGVPGVADVRVTGAASNGYVLSLRTADLTKNGITIDDIKQSLTEIQPAWVQGKITDSHVSIPIHASAWNQSEQDLRQLPIRAADGHIVALSTVADLSKSLLDMQTISRTDGSPSVVFDVLKTTSSNISEVSKRVHDRIREIPGVGQGDIKVIVLFDQGEQVKSALSGLIKEGLLGCLLSMVCVFVFFRNVRSTLLIALSLPICLAVTTGLLKTMGISLNILTVSGLIVAMGRVIDDTIVILDNIYRKTHETGMKLTSTILAETVMEMVPAIISATATTVAVYIPIVVIGGMIGAAFSGFAWSVVIALLTSLLVAMFVVPPFYHLCHKGRTHDSAVSIEPVSYKIVHWAFLSKRKIIAALGGLVIIAGWGACFLPVNFLPANRSGHINVQLEFPQGTALTQVDATVKRMEQTLKLNTEISTFSSVLGSSFTPQFDDVFDAGGGWIQSNNVANITVSMKPVADINKVTAELQKQLPSLAGNATCTVSDQNISGDDSQLTINLSGADLTTLDKTANLIRSKLQTVQGLSVAGAADDNEALPRFQLLLNRDAIARTGIEPEKIYSRIRQYLSEGTTVQVKTGEQETIPVAIHTNLLSKVGSSSTMVSPETEILTLLAQETFQAKNGSVVRLDELASLTPGNGTSVIREREGHPFSLITANITSRDVEKISGRVKDMLEHLVLPSGVHYTINGVTAQVHQMIYEMVVALSVSAVLVLFILSFVFRSWRAPLTILFCIPLAFIGSIIGMLISGGEWNLASLVGLLMLSGIVATNGIVLVDKIERNLAEGLIPQEAILTGTASRVRPVLMTAMTTILTLLPVCFSGSSDTVVSQSLGIVVVCGMISSTLISLLIIPLLYQWSLGENRVSLVAEHSTENNRRKGMIL
jgi:multidrug efflux pump subunit AcrB